MLAGTSGWIPEAERVELVSVIFVHARLKEKRIVMAPNLSILFVGSVIKNNQETREQVENQLFPRLSRAHARVGSGPASVALAGLTSNHVPNFNAPHRRYARTVACMLLTFHLAARWQKNVPQATRSRHTPRKLAPTPPSSTTSSLALTSTHLFP